MGKSWEIIDALRREKGASLKDLAVVCRVTPPSVQKWKKGGGVSLQCLDALAAYFDTSVGVLLGREQTVHMPIEKSEADAHSISPPAPCRYPADCDLTARLDRMEAQLQTLTQLLGATLAASSHTGVAREKQKAG